MAIPSFPIFPTFFFICHLLLFHSSQATNKTQNDCPEEFPCGGLNTTRFPLTQSSRPDCGLLRVDCDAKPYPKLDWGRDGYDIVYQDVPFLKLSDRKLSDLLQSRSCQSFNRNISFPNSPSVTYRVSPIITLLKCSNISSNKTGDQFLGYESYGCEGFSVYYYRNPNNFTGFNNVPPHCSVIQLPLKQNETSNNATDLFAMLGSEFFINWFLTENCSECHYRLGGQCVTDKKTNQFMCVHSSSSSPRKWILVPGACIGGIAIIIILMFYFRRKYLCGHVWSLIRTKTNDEQALENFLANYGSLAPKRYSYSELRKMTESFKNQLGQGGFGCVYKGKMHNGSLVAVKVLKDLKEDGEGFINEVASISRTSHVNIVSLNGFCFDGRKRALVYEFMSNGSLEKFIYENKSSTSRQLEWKVLYNIAIGIARGLEYLHRGCNTRILHFDIKPHNILLDENFCPKISDFGLAKLCVNKESTVSIVGARGTIGYIAPEVVCRSIGGISYKSDVYSYGMMVLEMVGGRKNVDVGVSRASEIYFPHWIHSRLQLDEELELTGIINEEENEYARKMVIVSLWCIQMDPAIRPSMSKIVEMLESNLSNLEIPPKPCFSSPSTSEVSYVRQSHNDTSPLTDNLA